MPKNIVICCDGTGNEIDTHLSNVLKLYRMLPETDRQVRYYDPGVGTLSDNLTWLPWLADTKRFFGLATGKGLHKNLLDAYCYLMDVYEDGDKIFLFGFSRGAYTVRALAGLIYQVGLLHPGQRNIAEYALDAYRVTDLLKLQEKKEKEKQKKRQKLKGNEIENKMDSNEYDEWRFSRVTGARRIPIHFLGLWDTVSSLLVPNPGAKTYLTFHNLPFTDENPAVKHIRHAAAIDERRRMFRLHRWKESGVYRPNPFVGEDEAQDFKEVWFAGVHSDIGGGYPEVDSGLAKIPLDWMIVEAKAKGLVIDEEFYNRLVLGNARAGSPREYVKPDSDAKLHKSLTGPWKLFEYWPKKVRWLDWNHKRTFLGLYFPLAEPRFIEPTACMHESVSRRIEADSTYRPVNLPRNAASESN